MRADVVRAPILLQPIRRPIPVTPPAAPVAAPVSQLARFDRGAVPADRAPVYVNLSAVCGVASVADAHALAQAFYAFVRQYAPTVPVTGMAPDYGYTVDALGYADGDHLPDVVIADANS